jgi:hypothetical protein
MLAYITYFELGAFVSSLAAWRVIRSSKYLRLFPLLLFVIVSVEIYETFFSPKGQPSNAWVYDIQIPLQHFLYLVILYNALNGTQYKRVIWAFMIFLPPFALVTELFFTEKNHFNVLSYCFGSLTLIIGIIIKFYEMLQNPVDFNFLKKPFFYMLFAFLLFNVGTLPYFAMGNWLYYTMGYKNTVFILVNVMSVLNYILYGTYTIAFLWMIKKKGYS